MRILLATDGSECSEAAARFLARLRLSANDEVVVLHVISEIPYDDDYHAKIKQAIKRISPRILRTSVNILKPLPAKVVVVEEEGAPDTEIIEAAVESKSDLIVMGARGLKGIRSFLVGSTTRSVAIHAPKPVLVTKPVRRPMTGPLKVLFAADGSEAARSTAELLATLPFPENTELSVMNVAWSAAENLPDRFLMEINGLTKDDLARARSIEFEESAKVIDKVVDSLGKRFVTIERIARGGDPAEQILHESEVLPADLIAVGSRGLRGIRGMLGSVSRRILGHAQCPVLIGKTGEH